MRIDLLRSLFPDGEDRPPRLKDEDAQAWTLNALGNSYSLSGQPRRAVPRFEASNDIDEKRGHKKGVAIGLGNLAIMAQFPIGALQATEANLRRSNALCWQIEDELQEAIVHLELGRLLAYRGAYAESETELATAFTMFKNRKHAQAQGVTSAYRALLELLELRSVSAANEPRSDISNTKSPITNRQSPWPAVCWNWRMRTPAPLIP